MTHESSRICFLGLTQCSDFASYLWEGGGLTSYLQRVETRGRDFTGSWASTLRIETTSGKADADVRAVAGGLQQDGADQHTLQQDQAHPQSMRPRPGRIHVKGSGCFGVVFGGVPEMIEGGCGQVFDVGLEAHVPA
eukprot:1045493-Rhodomonas_salina.2